MLLLLVSGPVSQKARNKSGVTLLVKAAPKGRYDLAWWQAWLADHW